MKILVHYRNLADVLLNRQQARPPLELIDRVGSALLEHRRLQVYIAEWGLQWLRQEVAHYADPEIAQDIERHLRHYFSVSPYVDRNTVEQFVRNLASSPAHTSVEISVEVFEFFQAIQMSADAILTSNSTAFRPFHLRVFPLNARTNPQQLLNAASSSRLPIVLEGDFTDLWFLTRATQGAAQSVPRQSSELLFERLSQSDRQSPQIGLPVNLQDWHHQNSLSTSWLSPDKLPYSARRVYAVRSKSLAMKGKEIAVKTPRSPKPETVLLLVSLEQKRSTYSVTVELASISRGLSLPPLQFRILDKTGQCQIERQTAKQSSIQINLEAETSEQFSVVVLGDHGIIHCEKFIV
jgi:hypothetical protein